MAATTTYLSIVNEAIVESGASMGTYATNGSDFITNPDAMAARFKNWVARAWQTIQQDCDDWEFMGEQGLVNITPGVMFYTDGTPVSAFAGALSNTQFNLYDVDGTVAVPNLSAGAFVDLTGLATNALPFGYFDFSGLTLTQPLQIALKPGSEYFTVPYSQPGSKITAFSGTETVATAGTFTGYVNNFTGNLTTSPMIVNLISGPNTYLVGLKSFTTTSFSYDLFSTPVITIDTSVNANVGGSFVDVNTGHVYGSWTNTSSGGFTGTGGIVVTPRTYRNAAVGQGFVHSWKSFNFSEETAPAGFLEDIQEIDPTSFRLIDRLSPAPEGEVPMPCMSWEQFRGPYDQSATYPGVPRLISEDDTGRWRLYPHPYYTMTLKFDYNRIPQVLSAFGDIPKGLNNDFTDIIMWLALIYYGQYDEQPAVVARAKSNYFALQIRMAKHYQQKYRLTPAKLY